jgi:uncharacterized membrane protein
MPLRTLPRLLTTLAITAASLAHAQSYTFIGYNIGPQDMTPDAQVVVGNSFVTGQPAAIHAFQWTTAGITINNAPSDPTFTTGNGISNDGSTLVGQMSTANPNINKAYRKGPDGIYQDISYAPTPAWRRSYAVASNSDGTVIACQTQFNTFNYSTYVWSQTSGFQLLGRLRPQDDGVTPRAISADGSVVAGRSMSSGDGIATAFLWSADTGMTAIPAPTGYIADDVVGISSDASTVLCAVFDNNYTTRRVGIYRNGVTTLLPLRYSLDFNADGPVALCDDGSTIIGQETTPFAVREFYIWRESTGKINLIDYWASFGIAIPSGYEISDVADLSANGDAMLVGFVPVNNTLGLPGISAIISIPSATSTALFGITFGSLARNRRR